MKKKLIPKSKLTETQIDSVKAAKLNDWGRMEMDILYECQRYWDNMREFREDRQRNKKYTYGDQWGDMIKVGGKMMREDDYIRSKGNIPLKNNLIRRLVRNVIGVYRNQMKEPICTARDKDEQMLGDTMSTLLQYNWQLNKMTELNGRSFEEFIISGMVAQKSSWIWRNNKMDCFVDYVNPNNLFFDTAMQDIRHWDLSVIGEIHDVSFGDLCSVFAKTKEDYDKLNDIYSSAKDRRFIESWTGRFGKYELHDVDFFWPYDATMCRVIEVWKKEQKPRYRCHDYLTGEWYKIETEDKASMVDAENQARIAEGIESGMEEGEIPLIEAEWFIDNYWYYRFLSPFGHILQEGETPYEHKSHPYTIKAYPFIDGEVHSFVADVIDQQRYVNRLITLNDWILRSAAKGALLFPKDCLPDDKTMEDIAESWAEVGSVIAYTPKPGVPIPQQISSSGTVVGLYDLLGMQLKFMEDISGVNGALQGKPGASGTSGALYAQQAQNATVSLVDMLDSYNSFERDVAYKNVKVIQQFYDDKRVMAIAGKKGKIDVSTPDKIRNVEFDLAITESVASPVSRALANELLMQIWANGQISVEQLLEHGSFPFADALLQDLKSQREQIEKGQTPDDLSPQMKQQIQEKMNSGAVDMLQRGLAA